VTGQQKQDLTSDGLKPGKSANSLYTIGSVDLPLLLSMMQMQRVTFLRPEWSGKLLKY